MANLVADCEVDQTRASLKSRPWFCRTMQTVSDDRPKCLGSGHTINNTEVGLCRGRWQWYQLSTVQEHTVPYYVTERPAGRGPAQHVRKTRVETQRHAVAIELQTSHCPHSSDPTCEALGGSVRDYYTTVDMLVIDGDPTHDWDSESPFPRGGVNAYYRGDYVGEQFRYFKSRKRVVMGLGYKVNRTRGGDNCAPQLRDKVNIGIYCSWCAHPGSAHPASAHPPRHPPHATRCPRLRPLRRPFRDHLRRRRRTACRRDEPAPGQGRGAWRRGEV